MKYHKIKIFTIFSVLSLNSCSIIQKDIELKLYPNTHKTLVREGEEVVFAITPKEKKGFKIDFGDGKFKNTSISDITCMSEYDCNPVYIEHTYTLPGGFTPVITYDNEKHPNNPNDLKVIIVSKNALTHRELKIRAIEDLVQKVKSGLKDQNMKCDKPCQQKISVGILKDANFEYKQDNIGEMQDLMLVKFLMNELVNSGFKVIEKHPQALISNSRSCYFPMKIS